MSLSLSPHLKSALLADSNPSRSLRSVSSSKTRLSRVSDALLQACREKEMSDDLLKTHSLTASIRELLPSIVQARKFMTWQEVADILSDDGVLWKNGNRLSGTDLSSLVYRVRKTEEERIEKRLNARLNGRQNVETLEDVFSNTRKVLRDKLYASSPVLSLFQDDFDKLLDEKLEDSSIQDSLKEENLSSQTVVSQESSSVQEKKGDLSSKDSLKASQVLETPSQISSDDLEKPLPTLEQRLSSQGCLKTPTYSLNVPLKNGLDNSSSKHVEMPAKRNRVFSEIRRAQRERGMSSS